MNHQTPVVILRSGHHGGLGIVRSLGRLSIPVYTVDSARWEPAFSSRYCRGRFLLDTTSGPPEKCVSKLREIGRKLGNKPVLIPTTDQGSLWVAENAPALQEEFRLARQPAGLVRVLSDKGRMQELAQSCGIATAQSAVPRSMEDVEQFIAAAVFPVMVKAIDTEAMRRASGGTKFIVRTPSELRSLYGKARRAGAANLLLQEMIPGEDWMFDGYFDRDSKCLFGVTGKKIRRFPVNTGITSLGICLRNDALADTTKDFMKTIGYQGILDIGYRYDNRDGKYKVLDINPRIGCTFRLFTAANGMDVARAIYLDLTGQPVPAGPAEEGRKWMVEDFDLFSALRSWKDRSLSFTNWFNSFRGVQETACFAWDDPVPFFLMGVADCCEFCSWVRNRVSARRAIRELSEA